MLSPEKHVEQQSERIDVGRGRYRSAENLLRSGELWGQRSPRFTGEFGRFACLGLVLEQLGDTKVEQLDATTARDQHIRWLYVPMYDQVRMRMRDGEHRDIKPSNVLVAS